MYFRDVIGKPIIFIVIMAFVQQKTEYDMEKYMFLDMVGTEDNPDYYMKNIGPGKRFTGGSTCK